MSLFCIIFAFGNGREVASLGFVLPSLWLRFAFALASLLESRSEPTKGRSKTKANCTNDWCRLMRTVYARQVLGGSQFSHGGW